MKRLTCVLLALMMAAGLTAFAFAEGEGYIGQYTKGNFRSMYDVYSGPGEQYYRANEGKAMYGSGAVRYYGAAPDGWIMIGYSTLPKQYRVGYIKASFADLNTKGKGKDRTLTLMHQDAIAQAPLDFFDDPGIGRKAAKPLVQIPQDAAVTYLGQFDKDWTYIEIGETYLGKPSRGFVKSGNLKFFVAGPGKTEGIASGTVLADGKTELTWDTSAMGWSRTVEISCAGEWKAIYDVAWLRLKAEGNTLKIQLEINGDKAERTAVISLVSGQATARVVVIQGGKE